MNKGERARQSLRLERRVWTAIDRACDKRPGNISRNTWIAEAVLEKLSRGKNEERSGEHNA
jgi:hypothetical protein